MHYIKLDELRTPRGYSLQRLNEVCNFRCYKGIVATLLKLNLEHTVIVCEIYGQDHMLMESDMIFLIDSHTLMRIYDKKKACDENLERLTAIWKKKRGESHADFLRTVDFLFKAQEAKRKKK